MEGGRSRPDRCNSCSGCSVGNAAYGTPILRGAERPFPATEVEQTWHEHG
jgi:hypothetical protein